MYVRKIRPIDGYLALAALLPFNEPLPPREQAPDALVEEVARRWIDAAAEKPELGLPPLPRMGSSSDDRYELVRQVRDIIGRIISVVSDPNVVRPTGRWTALLDERLTDLRLPPAPRGLTLTASGIVLYADPLGVFLNCLQQAGADIWALRKCPVCSAPFLPHRSDQKACTSKCNDIWRHRRLRREHANAQG